MNSAFQICLITIIQIFYVVLIIREFKQRPIFINYGTMLQYAFSESAILVFLVVLCVFSLLQNTDFYDSKTYSAMQTVVVVAVFVAIFAQVISVIWGIVFQVQEFLKKRAAKKNQEKLARIEKSLREATKNLQDLDMDEGKEDSNFLKKKKTILQQFQFWRLNFIPQRMSLRFWNSEIIQDFSSDLTVIHEANF